MATRSALLDVDHFQINGVSMHSETLVVEAASVERGTPLLDVDLGSVDSEVEAIPWVKSAHSARQWPGTVRIDVVERVAKAIIPASGGAYALIDESGVVIAEASVESAPDLPLINIPLAVKLGEVEQSVLPGLAVVNAMPPDLGRWVETILVDPISGKVGFDLVGSATAELGDQLLLADKMEALRSVLARADLTCVALIDVSVADLPTIKRDQVCEQSDPAAIDTSASG